jgi:rRNA maturation RNase YbeY
MTFDDLHNPDQPTFEVHNPVNFTLPVEGPHLLDILHHIEKKENVRFLQTEVAFVSEDEIVAVNKEYLDRDYVTDIISFRYDEDDSNQAIEGTLYCCAERIAEQAAEFNATVPEEFRRVFIHGLLHLIGYNDSTDKEKKEMTRLEDLYLSETLKLT